MNQDTSSPVHAPARPSVIRETGVMVTVDIADGLGYLAALLGMRSAVSKARDAGVARAVAALAPFRRCRFLLSPSRRSERT